MESIQLLLKVLPGFLLRGVVAVVCGAVIGIERERLGKPAGFRTNVLICLGSALYMISGRLVEEKLGLPSVDPTRIAAQVVTGIGFIGAGSIIQSRGTVTGLTSAATIWVVAAIGIIIGAGYPALGIVCTGLVLLTLVGLTRVEPRLLGACHLTTCEIVFGRGEDRWVAELTEILNEYEYRLSGPRLTTDGEGRSCVAFDYCDRHPSHRRFLAQIWRIPGIVEVKMSGGSAPKS